MVGARAGGTAFGALLLPLSFVVAQAKANTVRMRRIEIEPLRSICTASFKQKTPLSRRLCSQLVPNQRHYALARMWISTRRFNWRPLAVLLVDRG